MRHAETCCVDHAVLLLSAVGKDAALQVAEITVLMRQSSRLSQIKT